MKTAISIPDDIFEEAERLARRLGKSRSELYRDALAEYVARRDPGAVTEAIDRVLAAVGGTEDGFVATAGRRVLEDAGW